MQWAKKAKQKNSFNFDGVYIFQELDAIVASRIKECETLPKVFEAEIGVSAKEKNFQEALWVCNSQFRSSLPGRSYTSRIFIFTVNDYPNEDNEAQKQRINEYLKVR